MAPQLEVWLLAPVVLAGAFQDVWVPFSLGFFLGPPESQPASPLFYMLQVRALSNKILLWVTHG